MAERTEEELVQQGAQVAQTMLTGYDIGWDNAVSWAAEWIEGSLAGETNERMVEFARNMAMSIKANTRRRKCMNFAECGNFAKRAVSDICEECAENYQESTQY